VANLRDGAVVGFKSFDTQGVVRILLELRGRFRGRVSVSDTPCFGTVRGVAGLEVDGTEFAVHAVECRLPDGEHALYFTFEGEGAVDLDAFTLVTDEERP